MSLEKIRYPPDISQYVALLNGFEVLVVEYDTDGRQDFLIEKAFNNFNYKFIIHSPTSGFTLSIDQVSIILGALRKIEETYDILSE